jgi:hypothetical protein
MITFRDGIWVLVGITSCVPWPQGIAGLHCSLSVSIKDRSLHGPWSSHRFIIPSTYLLYGSGKACYYLVMGSGSFWTDWLEAGIGGGLSTVLRPGLKCGSWESKFGRGPGNPWHEWNGLVSFVPGVQARRVFFRYPVGHIDSRITVFTWRYDLTTLWHRSKNWQLKDEEMISFAQPCLIID